MRHFARFCFAKQDEALEEAIRRLGTYFKGTACLTPPAAMG